jgi:HD-GYP domain-containing protein (c-di-GMP phosphodiesterase class II)
MKSLPLADIKPDSYFDKPVRLDNSYILVVPGLPLTSEVIDRLQAWNFNAVQTAGSVVDKRSVSLQADQHEEAAGEGPARSAKEQRVVVFYEGLLAYAEATYEGYVEHNTLDIAALSSKIIETISVAKESRDSLLRSAVVTTVAENYLAAHSAFATVVSIAIGDFFKLPAHRLIDLGVAALLHEIGMSKLPCELYLASEPLTEDQKKTLMTHTVLGYRILKGFSVSENVALAALEHHERVDGSGYPKRLQNDSISLYARIISVACSFDAMVSERPFKEAKDGPQSILDLLKKNRQGYDERVLKALVYCVSLYPLGTSVLLSDGSIGIVCRANPKSPAFPVVELLRDADGNQPAKQVLVQTSSEGIGITRSLSREELAKKA